MKKASTAAALLIMVILVGFSAKNGDTKEIPDLLVPVSAKAEIPFLTEEVVKAELQNAKMDQNLVINRATKKVVKRLETASVTTGSALAISGGKAYDIQLTGEDSYVIPLYVGQAGVFSFSVKENGSKNTKQITVSVYEDKECKNKLRSFTLDRSKAVKMIGRVSIHKKGTYYLEFKVDAFQKTESSSLRFTSSLVNGKGRSIQSGEEIFVGAGSAKPIYYNITLKEDAVLGLLVKDNLVKGKTFALLYDKDKKKLSKDGSALTKEAIYFTLKKGTYYIKMQTEEGNIFSMKTAVIPVSDRSGSTKDTAFLLTRTKPETGMILEGDFNQTEKWYKMKLSKPQKVIIESYGGVSLTGTMRIEFLDANGKRFGERVLTKGNEDVSFRPSVTYKGKDAKKSGYLPAGTYYIKITKEEKDTTGYYSLTYKIETGK